MSTRNAAIILFLGALAVALSAIFVRLSELGPAATAVHRAGLAVPALFLWAKLQSRGKPVVPVKARDAWLLVLAGLFFAGDLAFWHWSITFTSVANASLFATSTPVFVALAAWLLLGERITRIFLLGMMLALAGAAILAGGSLTTEPGHLLGDAFGLVTAMFFTAYLLTVKGLRTRISAASLMAWSSLVTALALLPIALLAGESLIPQTTEGWLVLISLALISHVGGQGLIAVSVPHLPASFSAVALLSEAIMAAVMGWVLLGEALGWPQFWGGALVLAGIALARPRRPLSPPVASRP
tara:strand:- start:361 stop:1254 length:894 start_codon:yes stop_codon:yes gene_type:complete